MRLSHDVPKVEGEENNGCLFVTKFCSSRMDIKLLDAADVFLYVIRGFLR